MRIARWYSTLMKYNYDIEYRPGSDNKLADGLSRAPRKHYNDACDVDEEQICEIVQNDMQNNRPPPKVMLYCQKLQVTPTVNGQTKKILVKMYKGAKK